MCGARMSAGETGGESGRTRGAGVLREPLTSGPGVSVGGGRGGACGVRGCTGWQVGPGVRRGERGARALAGPHAAGLRAVCWAEGKGVRVGLRKRKEQAGLGCFGFWVFLFFLLFSISKHHSNYLNSNSNLNSTLALK